MFFDDISSAYIKDFLLDEIISIIRLAIQLVYNLRVYAFISYNYMNIFLIKVSYGSNSN